MTIGPAKQFNQDCFFDCVSLLNINYQSTSKSLLDSKCSEIQIFGVYQSETNISRNELVNIIQATGYPLADGFGEKKFQQIKFSSSQYTVIMGHKAIVEIERIL